MRSENELPFCLLSNNYSYLETESVSARCYFALVDIDEADDIVWTRLVLFISVEMVDDRISLVDREGLEHLVCHLSL